MILYDDVKFFIHLLMLEQVTRVLFSHPFFATMSIVDSEAVFGNRGLHIGVTETLLDLFKEAGNSTMGKLAFAS